VGGKEGGVRRTGEVNYGEVTQEGGPRIASLDVRRKQRNLVREDRISRKVNIFEKLKKCPYNIMTVGAEGGGGKGRCR